MNNEPTYTEKYKGLTINIFQDDTYDSPDDWGNTDAFIVHDHRDFTIERKGFNPSEIFEALQENPNKLFDGYRVFPLYAYIHSGIALSLGRNQYPFTCRWDTSFAGFVLVKHEKGMYTPKQARRIAEGLIETWNEYLSGNVYGFVVENSEGEQLDSCWGFYGDYEKGALLEARNSADHEYKKLVKTHSQKVKEWIKNKVNILHRKPLLF